MATPRVAVFSFNAKSRSERPLFYCSRCEASEMLEKGNARNVSKIRKTLTHIQLTRLQRDEKPSACTLTFGDMQSGYWEGGKSTQRVAEKVEAWPFVGDTKAVCVRPREAFSQ